MPNTERRRTGQLQRIGWLASVASASVLPFCMAAIIWASTEFWSAFKDMRADIWQIKVSMGQAVERGVATRRRLDIIEARVDRIQDRP